MGDQHPFVHTYRMRTALQKVLALMEQKQERRRSHFQRGRRGPDRGGADRRPQQTQAQEKPGRDQVDVEQIMRDIRGRIRQRQGIDLSDRQIQDLAARRLESILDPHAMNPSLLDALRRTASVAPPRSAREKSAEPAFTFEASTIYDSHRGALRLIRRLLNPLLKLFFNPTPLIHALHLQARLNVEAAERDADRDQRQAEWNALHFEILQRLVTEVSRVSLEFKPLAMHVESLDTKVDFNERRVRDVEGSVHRLRPQGRPAEPAAAAPAMGSDTAIAKGATEAAAVRVEGQPSDGTKRRRRRRRGRRTDISSGETVQVVEPVAVEDPVGLSAGPVDPSPTAEPAQDSRGNPPFTGPLTEPPPAVEHFARDGGAAPAPAAIPAEPQPSVEHVQDTGAARAPAAMLAASPPAVEQLAPDSGAVPAPAAVITEPQRNVERPAEDTAAVSAPAAILTESHPVVEHPPEDDGTAPVADRPDTDHTER